MADEARLLYIAGAMHCGSTALSLYLNQHSEMVAISQPEWLTSYAEEGKRLPCSCGQALTVCPFWRAVSAEFAGLTGEPRDPLFTDAYLETVGSLRVGAARAALHYCLLGIGSRSLLSWAARHAPTVNWNLCAGQRNLRLFEAVRRVAGKSAVIDASKIPSRAKLLYMSAPASTRIVWVVRDGRAATWSRIRSSGVSVEHAALAWLRANLEVWAALATIPRKHQMLVRHEDFCRHPNDVAARVTRLLDLPDEALGAQLEGASAHLMGGNDMRYLEGRMPIHLDEGWRHGLDPGQLRAFGRVAGWLNHALGYR